MSARTEVPAMARRMGRLIACLMLTPLLALGAAPAFFEVTEHGAECESLDLLLTSANSGIVRVRRCDDCPLMQLEVTADTRVYQAGALITLADADNNRDLGATVLFDPETGRVTRILLRKRPR